jgi:hypothetical protein
MLESVDEVARQISDDLLGDAIMGMAVSQTSNYAHSVEKEQLNCLLIAGGKPCDQGLNYELRNGLFAHYVSYKGMTFTSATTGPVPFLTSKELRAEDRKARSKLVK